jgi:preprotein translocase subunit YajC
MPSLFDASLLLFAQAQGGGKTPQAGGEFASMLVMFLPLILLFYFIILRPQQQQEKKRRQMIDALKPNDRVLTSAGIYGTVVKIDTEKNRITLRCDDVKLTFTRTSIVDVITTSSDGKAKASDLKDDSV